MNGNPIINRLQGEYKLHSFSVNLGDMSLKLTVEVVELELETKIDGKAYGFAWYRHSPTAASVQFMETIDEVEAAAFEVVLDQLDKLEERRYQKRVDSHVEELKKASRGLQYP